MFENSATRMELNNFAENDVDSEGKLWKGNHEELNIGNAKDASIDKVKAGQVS